MPEGLAVVSTLKRPVAVRKPAITVDYCEEKELWARHWQLRLAVERRAYQLFEQRGRRHGHDAEDWRRAEAELARPMPIQLREFADHFELAAALPGVAPRQLRVQVGRWALRLEAAADAGDAAGRTLVDELERRGFVRLIELPAPLAARGVKARLEHGLLILRLAKENESERLASPAKPRKAPAPRRRTPAARPH